MKSQNQRSIRYRSVGSGRRVLFEQLKLILVLFFTGCTLIALETSVCSRIPLPLPIPVLEGSCGAPALGLLFSMAVGFLWGEREGGITGLICGWLSDAVSIDTAVYGMMVLPLLYFLCGYMCGTVGRRRLAHNLPSFVVFSVVGGGIKCLFAVGLAYLELGALPPPVWVLRGLIPAWIWTVIFSVPVYGMLRGEMKLLEPK